MKYVFVGDIHGKYELIETALQKEGKKIFVGDFIDSFYRTLEDHKKCFDLVLDAIDKDEAIAIFGNHELSYIYPNHKCSGFTKERARLMAHYKERLLKNFKPFILLEDNFLVSHAGLDRRLWDANHLSFDSLEETLNNWWPNLTSPMHQIGKVRGGISDVGGMFWNDFNFEFVPIPDLVQVFGHTAGTSIRKNENSFCIDCLDKQTAFLELDL